MSNETKTVVTKVGKVDVNLDEIFNGAPSADSITLPEEDVKKPNVFSRKKDVDMSFIDKPAEEVKDEVEEITEEKVVEEVTETTDVKKDTVSKEQIDELLGDNQIEDEEEEVKETKKRGRKDFEELIQANLDERANAVRRETPKQFFDSLPQELQIAARYVADGGTDLKGIFKALSTVEETRDLNIKEERDQEHIIREYLGATGYGTQEEISEEIEVWKDLGKLETQAGKFKPKLDKMKEKVVAAKLQEQDMKRKQQEQASQNYMQSVYNTLKDGKVGGSKVDKKVQSLLYNGLVNPAYPSISGQNTNLLGHLLEKYQFVEPNYDLVSEALWLLADPNGYKSQIMKKGANKAVEQTVRKLKSAQGNRSSAAPVESTEPKARPKRQISRGNKNMFKRI